LVEEIAEAEAKLAPVQRPFTAVKTKASRQPQPFRKFTTSGGFNVLLGKDAKSNIALLKKHLEKNDVVLHADLPGSPATVVKMGLKASQQDLEEAAQMTACYSRAWREGFTNCKAGCCVQRASSRNRHLKRHTHSYARNFSNR
jgi:predicted ribosome quality control (RQC) complex YloA/Tae2 family protein